VTIADMFITRLRDQLTLQGLGLELSAKAQEYLAERATTPNWARDPASSDSAVRRGRVEREDPFQGFHAGQTIVVDVAEGDDGPYLTFDGVEGLPPSVDFEEPTLNA